MTLVIAIAVLVTSPLWAYAFVWLMMKLHGDL